jgi:hypothetical protein
MAQPGHPENTDTTGKQPGGNKLSGNRIIEFVYCSNTRFAPYMNVSIKISSKWMNIGQTMILKLILVPEKKRCHFPEYDFINLRTKEYNNREIEAELYTNSHMWLKKNVGYFIQTIENRFFWFNPILFFTKKSHTTQPRISCRWESSDLL